MLQMQGGIVSLSLEQQVPALANSNFRFRSSAIISPGYENGPTQYVFVAGSLQTCPFQPSMCQARRADICTVMWHAQSAFAAEMSAIDLSREHGHGATATPG